MVALLARKHGFLEGLFHTSVTIGPKTDFLARLLLQRGADPSLRATFRRRLRPTAHPEQEEVFEYRDVTPIGFAELIQEQNPQYVNDAAITAIREAGGE